MNDGLTVVSRLCIKSSLRQRTIPHSMFPPFYIRANYQPPAEGRAVG